MKIRGLARSSALAARSCEFIRLAELGGTARRRATTGQGRVGGPGGLQVHRTRTPSFITFLRVVFFPLLSAPGSGLLALSASLPPLHPWRTRTSFLPLLPPDPLYVPDPGVQSLTFHRARLIAVAVTYCAIRCTRALPRLSALRRGCGARGARGGTLLSARAGTKALSTARVRRRVPISRESRLQFDVRTPDANCGSRMAINGERSFPRRIHRVA